MKYLSILFVLTTFSIKVFSQENYKVTYNFIIDGNEIKAQSHILLTNNDKSYFFKENLLDYKREIRIETTTENDGKIVNRKYDTSFISSLTDSVEMLKAIKYKKKVGPGLTVTKDFSNKTLFFTGWSIFFKDTSSIQDSFNNLQWKFVKDTSKNLLNQKCKMATLKWRGRDYIAWYNPNITIFDGPYKFCGLPGLIIEIYDTDNNYKYVCTAISRIKEEIQIKKPKTFLTFDEYTIKLTKGINKIKEIIRSKDGINSDCTTCEQSESKSVYLPAGIERSLYVGL